jgi:hypothetical protein
LYDYDNAHDPLIQEMLGALKDALFYIPLEALTRARINNVIDRAEGIQPRRKEK